MSLFWRTFLWLVVLLAVCMGAWLQLFWMYEMQPRVQKNVTHIASLVNLSRAALVYAEPKARLSLIDTMAQQESVRILPREPSDQTLDYEHNPLTAGIHDALRQRLGEDTPMVRSVNGASGLWIGFEIEGDAYWLYAAPERLADVTVRTWVIGFFLLAALAFGGAALITRRLNQPLAQLAKAAKHISLGRFEGLPLDVAAPTPEVAQVNQAFVHMGEQLAHIEQNRRIMLAGLAHDVRTPLTRIRLESEMSVPDDQARSDLHADIEQIDQLVGKFLDYAQEQPLQTERLQLKPYLDSVLVPYRSRTHMDLSEVEGLIVGQNLCVDADPTELSRCIVNVLENARRYGRSADGICHLQVKVQAHARSGVVMLSFTDQGAGVPEAIVPQLTQAFFRADTARTAAKGSGLGLAIVEKNLHRMGGQLQLRNSSPHGLCVTFVLPQLI